MKSREKSKSRESVGKEEEDQQRVRCREQVVEDAFLEPVEALFGTTRWLAATRHLGACSLQCSPSCRARASNQLQPTTSLLALSSCLLILHLFVRLVHFHPIL